VEWKCAIVAQFPSRSRRSDLGFLLIVMQNKQRRLVAFAALVAAITLGAAVYWRYSITSIKLQGRMCEGLAAVKIGQHWGYVDENGRIAIPPQFEWAGEFHQEMAAFCSHRKFGFIDKGGVVQIQAQFKNVREFSEGLAAVQLEGQWGFIDRTGAFVIEPQYDCALPFSEGLAGALRNPGGYGYIDKTGSFVIAPQFYGTREFSEGLAAVEVATELSPTRQEIKSGYVDRKGRMIIEPQFAFAYPFRNGYAIVRKVATPEWWYIDRSGRLVEGPQKDWRQLRRPGNTGHNQPTEATSQKRRASWTALPTTLLEKVRQNMTSTLTAATNSTINNSIIVQRRGCRQAKPKRWTIMRPAFSRMQWIRIDATDMRLNPVLRSRPSARPCHGDNAAAVQWLTERGR
jgi:hypothetical protein